jgi:hypothetical protein
MPWSPSVPAAAPGTSIVADDARTVREWLRCTTLPHGQVRVGSGEIAIGVESLPPVSPVQRGLYEQAVDSAGVDPDNVVVVRITEAGIEVDAIDADDPRWPVRTRLLGPAELRERVRRHGLPGAELSIDR